MSIDKLEPFRWIKKKYLIKGKKPVYGWQDDYMWYPHMNRNWFGVICKELLCI